MNKQIAQKILIVAGILLLLVAGGITGYFYSEPQSTSSTSTSFENNLDQIHQSDLLNSTELITSQTSNLTATEIDGLIQMREEEKLARDVYLQMYDKWGQNIFKNISSSESSHTNTVKSLLDKYKITDPVKSDNRGSFTNQEIAKLYTDLVDRGNKSIEDALTVGALVEDLDINDLDKFLKETSNSDIITVYKNLQKGSRNHMRSFVSTLGRYGKSYEPTYISKDAYLSIISSGTEKGTVR